MLCQNALGIKPKVKPAAESPEEEVVRKTLGSRCESRSTLGRKIKMIANAEPKKLQQAVAMYRGLDRNFVMTRISGQTFAMNNRVVFDVPLESKARSYAAN